MLRKFTYTAIICSNRFSPLTYRVLDAVLKNNPDQVVVVNDAGYTVEVSENVYLLETSGSIGLAAARNMALDHATSDYILFCDDDDLWIDNKIEKIDGALTEHQCRFLVHSSRIYDHSDQTIVATITPHRMNRFKRRGRWLWLNYLLYAMPIPNSSCWCVAKSEFDHIRFDPAVRRGVDGTFWFKYLSLYRSPPEWLDEPLTDYGINHSHERITSASKESRKLAKDGRKRNRAYISPIYFAPALIKWWLDDL